MTTNSKCDVALGFVATTMILFILFLLLWACPTQAQPKVRIDSIGNYVSLTSIKAKGIDSPTGKFYIDSKGLKYPVYKTSTGRIVYHRISKNTGKEYKVYLDAK